MAVLVAVLFAFSRFSAENKVTALRASGVSLMTLVRPVLVAGVLTALANLLFNDQVLPRADHGCARCRRTSPGRSRAARAGGINEVMAGRLFLRAGRLDRGDEREYADARSSVSTPRGARRSMPTAARWD